jgi:5-methyltetrahydropteroyltriglutamate--homocysteine methyltransferase
MTKSRPPFRADHVGSLLRPAAVKQARDKNARGEIDADELRQVEDRAIIDLIKMQEEAGLQAVTDGEARRSWWHLDFLWGLDGCEKYLMEEGVAFAGARTRAEGVKVSGKVGFSGHPMLEHFRFLKEHTGRTPKMTIPSPSAIYGRLHGHMIDRGVYPDLDAFFADLGGAYRRAVRAFADAGCRYLQLDEVFIALLCDEKYRQGLRDRGDDPGRIGEIFGGLINEAMSDIPDDMTVTMHLCRGNFRSTHVGEGGYAPVAEVLFDLVKVHGYFMEYDTDRAGDFEPLRRMPKDGRRIVLGLVTSKSGELETRDDLMRRIEEAAGIVPLDQLCLSPQCGFASTEEGNVLTEEQQWAKLAMIVEIANEVWGGL